MHELAQIAAPLLEPAHGSNGATALALLALALACGVLSLVVVWRRWAFLGEGIAHAGFGGAGTAWFLAAAFPIFDGSGWVSMAVVVFCLLTAAAIGAVHRSGQVHSDTAIGAFLAGTLAWGFLGQQVYFMTYGRVPSGFTALLFGQTQLLGPLHAQLSVATLLLTIGVVVALRRDILLYCLEPSLAQTSGIRTTRVHYVLILLIALAIIVGVRLIGSVLITAMLILPGATAMLLTRRLVPSVVLAAGISCLGVVCGLATGRWWPALPQGPLIVLSLFIVFIGTWGVTRLRRVG